VSFLCLTSLYRRTLSVPAKFDLAQVPRRVIKRCVSPDKRVAFNVRMTLYSIHQFRHDQGRVSTYFLYQGPVVVRTLCFLVDYEQGKLTKQNLVFYSFPSIKPEVVIQALSREFPFLRWVVTISTVELVPDQRTSYVVDSRRCRRSRLFLPLPRIKQSGQER
jgi:hypothetical protein